MVQFALPFRSQVPQYPVGGGGIDLSAAYYVIYGGSLIGIWILIYLFISQITVKGAI